MEGEFTIKKSKYATSIGIIGVPDKITITNLEKELGKPMKMIEKNDKIILLIGRGLFRKKIVIPVNK